jgi:putative protease
LLSPKDLAGAAAVGALAEIGVASLKIEGRLKGPAYVATAVAHYRRAVAEAVGEPTPATELPIDAASLGVAYSRGESTGFLLGADHQTLVEGRFPRHRGLPLGRVVAVEGELVTVVPDARQRPITGGLAIGAPPADAGPAEPAIAPRAGMGVVFDRGRPEEREQGGPIFGVDATRDGFRLRFGHPGPDLAEVAPGDFVWISSDPQVTRAGERAAVAGREALGRIAIDLAVTGTAGTSLIVAATARGHAVEVCSAMPLAAARNTGLDATLLADKLGGLGGTPFHLGGLDTSALAPGLHLPVSELKDLRRRIVAALDAAIVRVDRRITADPVHAFVSPEVSAAPPAAPLLVPLCRTDAQLDAVLDAGAAEVELDWMELVGLGKAVERARQRGARVAVATVRVQKPGEERIDAHLARLAPDAVLVRSWGSLAALATAGPVLHGDFSLNITNSIAARWVLARGLTTVTAAHDLDRDQLLALVHASPRGRIAVAIHHHIPTFHTEHCVYAHLLSTGRDYRTCGRPCERHAVALRDRVGMIHPVVVDVGCRNTVFNAQAQSAASLVPELVTRGVQRFRLELVRETANEAARLVAAYRELVAGTLAPAEVVRRAAVHEQFGVTRGTMRTLTVLA